IASAGHAHAHSSQPMHFSSPSGQRLSWCRPWNRGAVGFFSKGYCSVTTFLNMVRNVTPKPATGSQNCSFSVGIYSRFPVEPAVVEPAVDPADDPADERGGGTG